VTQIASKPASPPLYASPPLLGVLPEIRRDALGFMDKLLAYPEPVVRYRIGPGLAQLVKHPDGIKRVLQDNVRNYTKDHFSYSMVRWTTGDGLLTSQGDRWLRQRRLAAPAFHRERIAALVTMFSAAATALVTRWERLPAGSTVQLDHDLTELTLTIVGQALFGTQLSAETTAVSAAFNELSAQLVGRFRSGNPFKPRLPFGADARWNRAAREIDRVVLQIIAARRRDPADQGDLLSMFMLATDQETGERMTDEQLRAEVLTMLLAGHETTATLLAWTFVLLAQHPAAEQRLHAELDAQLHGAPQMADLAGMPYSRMVLDETLRLKPPVYVLSRSVKADDQICGYHIPAGSSIDLSPYITHRLPEFWEQPEAFLPERFAPEHEQTRPRFAYFPFLGGPRQCIGNMFALTEAQVVLGTLARRVRLTLPPATVVRKDPLVTLRPHAGLRFGLDWR
jgi:cytochrome P450